ncbi:hypothetical protein ASG87_13205 [Frateuria sp. Soil773]|nr:hypothetical protein ASG87_13205 [Frateuria sp. Soil773]
MQRHIIRFLQGADVTPVARDDLDAIDVPVIVRQRGDEAGQEVGAFLAIQAACPEQSLAGS